MDAPGRIYAPVTLVTLAICALATLIVLWIGRAHKYPHAYALAWQYAKAVELNSLPCREGLAFEALLALLGAAARDGVPLLESSLNLNVNVT